MPRVLTCQEIVELVTDYLDGALDDERQAQVEVHLAGCPGCHVYVTQIRQAAAAARALSDDAGVVADCEELVRAFRGLTREG